jgi:autotransporter-associated beta strand protein
MKHIGHRYLKSVLMAAAVSAAISGHGAIQSDLVCSYPPSTASAWGGEANTWVNIANQVIGSDALNDQSGTGENLNIVGYFMSSRDSSGEDNATVLGLVSGDPSYADVRNYAASVGADQVLYIPYASTGSAGNAGQPGTYSAISSTWWWMVVFAHEAGGHNYSLGHGDGHLNPKTIMLHNYCGGGAAWPYLYSNPNVWLNGVNMLGDGATTCPSAGNTQPNGGDGAYGISSHCQSMCDTTLRVVYGPVLNKMIYHWSFTNAPGSAPASTTNYDLISGAPAVVRGNGATYTGSALRIPGGTTGNVAMNSMSAYIDLPNGIISSQTNLTIEVWATPLSAPNWARILDFGRTTEAGDGLGAAGEWTGTPGTAAPGSTTGSDEILLSAAIGTDLNQQRFMSGLNGTLSTEDSALATTAGVQHHYAITFTDGAGSYTTNGGRWEWYRDGAIVTFLDVSNHLASIEDVNNWLGRSLWSGDSNANNDYTEVRISNVALNQFQVMANYLVGPNYIPRSTSLTAGDLWNGGTRSFNTAGNWSDGLAPSAGKSYEMSDFNLTTPNTTTSYAFAGDSLHASGGIFFDGASGSSTITINKFQIDNEELCNTAGGTFTLAGNLYVTNNNIVRGAGGPVNVTANLNGNGSLTLYANKVSLTGNNTNYTGKIRVGNGMTGALNLSSEAQLGTNPSSFTSDQLIFNRGWLYTTTSFTISNSNRGITIGANNGIFDVASGTTLTLGCPLSSGYTSVSANQMVTVGQVSGVVAGVLIKQNSGTLALTSANPNYNGAISITGGTLSLAGAGQLGGGTFGNPFTDNGVFDYSSSAAQTISSAIAGSGAITKNGAGTLTLSGANTLSGSVTINSGTLYANAANVATNCAFSYVSGVTINSGATLQSSANALFGSDGTQGHPITVNAGGTLICDSGADVGVSTVTLNGGTLASLGASTALGSWRFDNAGDVLAVTADSTVSAVNVKFANGGTINVSAGKTLNFNGTITDTSSGGASSVAFGGGGTAVFTGANPYTGNTMINAGRLVLTNSCSLSSSNIVTASGAIFDVSGLASTFTVKAGQMLGGSGTNIGPVMTVSGAKVSAGTDGGYGTNYFTTNVTMVAGANLCFDLGTSATGSNDKIIFSGNLNLNSTAIRIKAPNAGAILDSSTDYTLANVTGTISGTVNATPVWDVQAGNYGAFAVVVTNGNKIVLHAVAVPPVIIGASISTGSVGRNQTFNISVSATQGGYAISNATANVTAIGGSSALALTGDGAGHYTNSVAATADTTFGSKTINLLVTDAGNISATTNISVTVVATNRVWGGGSASDNNWSSNPNWSTIAAPGFAGDSVVFGGSTRLAPLMETNYSVTGLTFNNTAGSFTLGTSGNFLTLTGSGVTNNSVNPQTLNVPISMSTTQTLNAAAGNLTFGGNITNNGYLLTVTGNSNTTVSGAISGSAGLVKIGTGTLNLSGNSPAFGGSITNNAGSVNVTGGSTTVGGNLIINAGSVSVTGGSLALTNTSPIFIGYETTTGAVNVAGSGLLTALGPVWVGGSDQSGSAYNAMGILNISNGTAYFGSSSSPHFRDGSLALAASQNYQNSCSGTMTVSGGTAWCTNDLIVGYSGAGAGTLNISGTGVVNVGPTAAKWLLLGEWDTCKGSINISGGNLNLLNNSSIKFSPGDTSATSTTNVINQSGGTITFYSNAGATVGGSGDLDLQNAGTSVCSNTYNLNGGLLIVPQIDSSTTTGERVFNFNGGTLKAAKANTTFMNLGAGNAVANVRNNGAIIDDGGYAITIAQPLIHSAIAGDNVIDGGLIKRGAGTLSLSGTNTYNGNTTINAGTLALSGSGSIASSGIIISNGAIFNVSAVSFTLGAGQTLMGSGTVTGGSTINGTIAPGVAAIGTLTFSTPPVLTSGKTLLELNRTNAQTSDRITVSGTLVYAGTLTVTNIGPALQAGDSFQLFSASGYSGAFNTTNLPALGSGLVWSNSLAANGKMAVVSTVSLVPTNVVLVVSGANLTLSWPADHTGWRLLMQTNNLGFGISANTNDWMTVGNSQLTNQVGLPLDLTLPGEFFRLVFP